MREVVEPRGDYEINVELPVSAAMYFVRVQGDSIIGKKDNRAFDALNRHYGHGMVFSASEGIKRERKMKRSLLGKRTTTCWDDIEEFSGPGSVWRMTAGSGSGFEPKILRRNFSRETSVSGEKNR